MKLKHRRVNGIPHVYTQRRTEETAADTSTLLPTCAVTALIRVVLAPPTYSEMAEALAAKTRCPKGHECPTLQRVFRTLNLQEADVLNVYLVGSHMWGTCSKHSDWDLVIVVRQLASAKPINKHKSNIEAFILSREDFTQFVRDHLMQVLLVLWLPRECVLLEKFDPQKSWFVFDQEALVKSLAHSRERDMRIAEKHFQKGDRSKAKKVLLHCMRYLEMGAQIRESGRITDYPAASSQRTVIFENLSAVWSELEEELRPVMDALWTRIIS